MPVPDRSNFEKAYAGEAPWDIDRPQAPFVKMADQVVSPVLDSGCGTGETSLYFAARGHTVTGIDYLDEPIRRARAKAAERKLHVEFLAKDATALGEWDRRFATVIDSGLFHVFSDDDRKRYVAGLAHVLSPGGRLFLMCFSEHEPGAEGPRRVTQQELRDAFSHGWQIDSIEPSHFEVNPRFTGMEFSPGGPKAWFACIRRAP